MIATSPPTVGDINSLKVGKQEFAEYLRSVRPHIDRMPVEKQMAILQAIKRLQHLELVESAKTNFFPFFRLMYPKFAIGKHHHTISSEFDNIVAGVLDRITISLPPRYTKSEMSSVAFPAYYLGRYPDRFIIQASANDELATGFGRKVKLMIASPEYQEVFPGVKLSKDSKASGRFATDQGGTYYAVGRGGGLAGKGAHLFIGDDILDEKSVLSGGMEVFEKAWEWMQAGPIQRLQPEGAIALIGTRWSKADPIGKVHSASAKDPEADKYKKIEVPAIDENGNSTFPEFWPTEKLLRKKRSMISMYWNAQYQQKPTAVEDSIVPKSAWKIWERTNADGDFLTPQLLSTLMVMDTAYTDGKRSNPSAFTIWGLFEYKNDITGKVENHMILLNAHKAKMTFDDLKKEAKRLIKSWAPDKILIEKKSSGPFLISELRKANIYAHAADPKGQSKMLRLNAVSDVWTGGYVFYIPTVANDAVVQEVADFPGGEEDDYTDCCAYAAQFFRKGGMLPSPNDNEEDEQQDDYQEIPQYY